MDRPGDNHTKYIRQRQISMILLLCRILKKDAVNLFTRQKQTQRREQTYGNLWLPGERDGFKVQD